MTKTELLAQGLELITTSTTDKKKTKEQLAAAFQELLAQYKGTKDKKESTARLMFVEKDGVTYKWCNRHEQYETIEQFGTIPTKKGEETKYNPECLAATTQWKAYNSEISKKEKLTMTLIEDVEALREHLRGINDLKTLRAGPSGYLSSKPVEGVLVN